MPAAAGGSAGAWAKRSHDRVSNHSPQAAHCFQVQGGPVCAVREAMLPWLCSGSDHQAHITATVMLAPEEATRDARLRAPPLLRLASYPRMVVGR